MQLQDVKRKNLNKRKRVRVGRGGKRGFTSGKGTKGQKSRSGHRIRPAIRDLIQRLPKLRGYANKSIAKDVIIFNVGDLENLKTSVISLEALRKAGIIRARDSRVKILGNGEIKKAFMVEGVAVSKEAKKKIEAAGGKVS